jgi:serine/threonine-protein kinase
MVARFTREAVLAARQIHPTVVQTEDVGRTADGLPFMVMELLKGRSLDEEIKKGGALSLDRCLEIVRLVLDGLAATHARGLVHRDVKPANIYLVEPGSTFGPPVRLLDLGLAKSLMDDDHLTAAGQMLGTPTYIAPETILEPRLGKPWTAASDVFSLGLVIHVMLTGRLPFEIDIGSKTVEKIIALHRYYMSKVRAGEELIGSTIPGNDLPRELVAMLRRSLAIKPERRFRDAGEMLAAFDEAIAPDDGLGECTHESLTPYEAIDCYRSLVIAPTSQAASGSPSRPVGVDARPRLASQPWVLAVTSGLAAAIMTFSGVLVWSLLDGRVSFVRTAAAAANEAPGGHQGRADEAAQAPAGRPPVAIPVEDGPAGDPGSLVKVRVVGLPRALPRTVMFNSRAIEGQWITGAEGERGTRVVLVEDHEPYRQSLVLRPHGVVDLRGRLRRASGAESPPSEKRRRPRIIADLPDGQRGATPSRQGAATVIVNG